MAKLIFDVSDSPDDHREIEVEDFADSWTLREEADGVSKRLAMRNA